MQNNPIRYSDPSGHRICEEVDGQCLSEKQATNIWKSRSKPQKPKPPLGPGSVDIDVLIPNDLVEDLGESYSHPDDPSIPLFDFFEEVFEFPGYGLKDLANQSYFKFAENLPPNVRLSLIYYYGQDRFNLQDLHIYNYANYDITISNVFVYTEPLGNTFAPARINQDDIRGTVLSPNTSISVHLNPTTTLSNNNGATIGPSGLYNWETAYVSIYLAATTGYIREIEFVVPGRTVGELPSVK